MTIQPLPGSDLGWREFAAKFWPQLSAYAPRHEKLWGWFDALTPGVRPAAEIDVWPRGGGKSSTVEKGVALCCARLTRRFALIVSRTQDQADAHVGDVSSALMAVGAEPKISRIGRPEAWRRDQLQTANGFIVAGFGAESASRGIKIDDYRPDIIIFDDIDNREDSLDLVEKLVRAITQTILPVGSSDCAVVYVQTMTQARGVMANVSSDRATFLLDRNPVTVDPAVIGLETTIVDQGPGQPPKYQVTGGRATWVGQSLATCEAQINQWGYDAFQREAQHDVRSGGALAFPMFEGPNYKALGVDGRHIVQPFDISPYATWFAGKDWGFNAPHALILFAIEPDGCVYAVEELVERHKTDEDQADAEYRLYQRYGLIDRDGRPTILTYADSAMWSKRDEDLVGHTRVETYLAKGLQYVPCSKTEDARTNGWSLIRSMLTAEKWFKIFAGRCPVLCKQLTEAVTRKARPEDIDDDADTPPSHMDAINALRYALYTRQEAPKNPKDIPDPHVQAATYLDHMARKTAAEFDEDADDNRPWGY